MALRSNWPVRPTNNITDADRELLKRELESRPRPVLEWFKVCDVTCLMDVDVFLSILVDNPAAAARIALEAITMGISIGDEGEAR